MFSISNILLTILIIFIIVSFGVGIHNIVEEDTIIAPLPHTCWGWEPTLIEKVTAIYVFICNWMVALSFMGLVFVSALWIVYTVTHSELETKKSGISYSYIEEEERPQTKSICNWFGLAKNIIEEQERKGYRYTGTSSGIICNEQLNFVKIKN